MSKLRFLIYVLFTFFLLFSFLFFLSSPPYPFPRAPPARPVSSSPPSPPHRSPRAPPPRAPSAAAPLHRIVLLHATGRLGPRHRAPPGPPPSSAAAGPLPPRGPQPGLLLLPTVRRGPATCSSRCPCDRRRQATSSSWSALLRPTRRAPPGAGLGNRGAARSHVFVAPSPPNRSRERKSGGFTAGAGAVHAFGRGPAEAGFGAAAGVLPNRASDLQKYFLCLSGRRQKIVLCRDTVCPAPGRVTG